MNLENKWSTFLFVLFFATAFSCGQDKKEATDYLNAGETILFDNIKYNLVWSSHPSDDYYKQEYLPEGDTIEKFKKIILLEAATGKSQLDEIVSSKVSELTKMKESNPMVNYEMFKKDGEIMIDFLLSENTSDGTDLKLVERNVYRYKPLSEKSGKEGVLLFGISERAYGDDIYKFLLTLKEDKFDILDEAGAFTVPEVTIAK